MNHHSFIETILWLSHFRYRNIPPGKMEWNFQIVHLSINKIYNPWNEKREITIWWIYDAEKLALIAAQATNRRGRFVVQW